jgi:hypothetical protein
MLINGLFLIFMTWSLWRFAAPLKRVAPLPYRLLVLWTAISCGIWLWRNWSNVLGVAVTVAASWLLWQAGLGNELLRLGRRVRGWLP